MIVLMSANKRGEKGEIFVFVPRNSLYFLLDFMCIAVSR